MYPINAASPERVAIGAVVLIADGTVQTSGVTVSVTKQGGAETGSAGTIAYSTGGIVFYTPTQSETNATSFILTAYKASCIPVSITIVTTASGTPGYAGVDWAKVTNATTAVNLSATNIDVDQVVASVTGAVGSVTGLTAADVGAIKTKTDFLPSFTAGSAGGLFIAGINAPVTITGSGDALTLTSTGGNGDGLAITGNGSGAGMNVTGGATGAGAEFHSAGGNRGGIESYSAVGQGLYLEGGSGADGHGFWINGGTTGDGIRAASAGGVPIRGNITADITGTLSTVTNLTTNNDKTGYALSATGSAAFTEGYRADGATGTLPQLLYEVIAHLGESSIVSTTKTIKKVDGSTTAATFTLNDATTPTSITRAT